jgi:hypothetical protein
LDFLDAAWPPGEQDRGAHAQPSAHRLSERRQLDRELVGTDRHRRAKRKVGMNPDDAQARDANTVEKYKA